MVIPKFVHLNIRSDFSIVDGLANPYKIVQEAKNLNMGAIAITDLNNLFSSLKFYKVANKMGIKPIIGIDIYVQSMFQDNIIKKITLLACTKEGYRNLSMLVTLAHKIDKVNMVKVCLQQKWLTIYNKGLILLSGGISGELGYSLLKKNWKMVDKIILFYDKYFPNSFYLQLERINQKDENLYITRVLSLARIKGIPVVATNSVCFLKKKDFYIHNIRVAINRRIMISDTDFKKSYTCHQFLKSENEMIQLFRDIPEAVKNSVEIAKRCNYFFELNKIYLPVFNTGTDTEQNFLIKSAYFGLKERLNSLKIKKKNNYFIDHKKYINRLQEELKVINDMGFPGYFLIVMEFIQWAKKNNIAVGPGRGSGAGSLVAYALKITEVDPLQFDLLFERFLNPHRVSMPDFDIDFCMEKRDLVIEHVAKKYGTDSVAQIITFGTMTAKAVVRDVGRVLGYPYGFINNLSKLIPMDVGVKLQEALLMSNELQELYNTNEDVKIVVDISKKLEGVTRNVGKHAGGVIISPFQITNFVPLYFDENSNNPLTQFDKYDIESIGLVKFDFLGLKTLTVIQRTVNTINKNRKNSDQYININTISLYDKKPFSILKCSETSGIFQLESLGMKDLIRRLKPDSFEDIIALVALFRPGPLQSGMVDNFINRKHRKEKISYPDVKWQHLCLKPILESTYGIILYQEQVMKIAQVLAGYTLSEADILRRAIGKKDPIEMEKQRLIFQKGAQKKKISISLSIKIFDLLEKFAGYGFNKSHSAAYALITYQTIWLKYYYPEEFLSAVMTSDMDNIDKLIKLIEECKRMKIKILSPCVNHGYYHFHVNKKQEIIYGMGAIKGIGSHSINLIIKNRKKYGFFIDLFDFCLRIVVYKITVKIVEKLIMAGCFDFTYIDRSILVGTLPSIFISVKQYLLFKSQNQQDFFGSPLKELKMLSTNNKENIYSKWTKKTKLDHEYAVLGVYLSGHPFNEYYFELKKYIKSTKIIKISKISINKFVVVTGIIKYVKFKNTKNNKKIAIISIDDSSAIIEVVVFSNLIENVRCFLKKDTILIVKGKISFDNFNNQLKITAVNITDIEYARHTCLSKIVIYIDKNVISQNNISDIQNILKKNKKGNTLFEICYLHAHVKEFSTLQNSWNIFPDNNFINLIYSFSFIQKINLFFRKDNDINIFKIYSS
ncbi:DNA polymerase III subunit alpha [Buchnera aphidicola (Thelaxes californica)]|uniref:DNA polymerase III subunit alpha n=1 Tax=Buchnera aphidicola (Thelaxes californica) TaxID=1315998 RepID=A0A4D6YF79_9GAMM|nr:DNA polymerase III subunit alpha [Buchnera aphidicola]QCI26723.1 DNA polymerase III subunit alpha [Buchnera aphidicola (Thelaxes californica)]